MNQTVDTLPLGHCFPAGFKSDSRLFKRVFSALTFLGLTTDIHRMQTVIPAGPQRGGDRLSYPRGRGVGGNDISNTVVLSREPWILLPSPLFGSSGPRLFHPRPLSQRS